MINISINPENDKKSSSKFIKIYFEVPYGVPYQNTTMKWRFKGDDDWNYLDSPYAFIRITEPKVIQCYQEFLFDSESYTNLKESSLLNEEEYNKIKSLKNLIDVNPIADPNTKYEVVEFNKFGEFDIGKPEPIELFNGYDGFITNGVGYLKIANTTLNEITVTDNDVQIHSTKKGIDNESKFEYNEFLIKGSGSHIIVIKSEKNGNYFEKKITLTVENIEPPKITIPNIKEGKIYPSIVPIIKVIPPECSKTLTLVKINNDGSEISRNEIIEGSGISETGNYVLEVLATRNDNYVSSMNNVSFTIDAETIGDIEILGVEENDIKETYEIRVLVENGIDYLIKVDEETIDALEMFDGGKKYLRFYYNTIGEHSLSVEATKLLDGTKRLKEVSLFTVYESTDYVESKIIDIEPHSDYSYSKDLTFTFSDKEENKKIIKFGSDIDYSWDDLTKDIKYPEGLDLNYFKDIKIFENIIEKDSLYASEEDFYSKQVVNQDNDSVISVDHLPPPKPIITGVYDNQVKESFLIDIKNKDNYRFNYIVKLNGNEISIDDFPLVVNKENHYSLQVICMKNNFTTSESNVFFRVKEKLRLLAPYIFYVPVRKDVRPIPGVKVIIHFHPYSCKHTFNIDKHLVNKFQINDMPVQTVPSHKDEIEFYVNENTIIRAWVQDDIGNYLTERYSKCCVSSNPLSCHNDWNVDYKEMYDNEKFWNIEMYYYPKLQERFIGVRHRTIENIDEKHTESVFPPEIIGIDKTDYIQYIAYPNVKRRKNHYYYSYLDGKPYELGTPITNNDLPKISKHKLVVFAENKINGLRASSSIEFFIDTVPPPAPKLINDENKVIFGKEKLDFLLENINSDIEYTATINGKPFDMFTKIEKDGEYLICVTATKKSNKTKRFRAFYLTINTLKKMSLEPLRLALKPLLFENFKKSVENEMMIDKETGDIYYKKKDGTIISKTKELADRINKIEMINVDIEKKYYIHYQQIETLFERVKYSFENLPNVFEMFDEAYVYYKELVEEANRLNSLTKQRTIRLTEIESEIDDLVDQSKLLDKLSLDITTKMNIDRVKAFKIIRQEILKTFDKFAVANQKEKEYERISKNRYKHSQFVVWRANELRKFENLKAKLIAKVESIRKFKEQNKIK